MFRGWFSDYNSVERVNLLFVVPSFTSYTTKTLLKRLRFVYKTGISCTNPDSRVQNWRFVYKKLLLGLQTCTSLYKNASRIAIKLLVGTGPPSPFFRGFEKVRNSLICFVFVRFLYIIGGSRRCLTYFDFSLLWLSLTSWRRGAERCPNGAFAVGESEAEAWWARESD